MQISSRMRLVTGATSISFLLLSTACSGGGSTRLASVGTAAADQRSAPAGSADGSGAADAGSTGTGATAGGSADGGSLATNGNAVLGVADTGSNLTRTVSAVVPGASGLTGASPVGLTVADTSVAGSSASPVSAAVLTNGRIVNVGTGATPSTTGLLSGANGLANANVGNGSLISGGTPVVGLGAASPTQPIGSVATVGVLTNGQTATVGATGSGAGSVLPTNGLANATAGNGTLIAGQSLIVGTSVASPTQSTGSLASIGALTNGQAAGASLTPAVTSGSATGLVSGLVRR